MLFLTGDFRVDKIRTSDVVRLRLGQLQLSNSIQERGNRKTRLNCAKGEDG